jgi:hypothetical protein
MGLAELGVRTLTVLLKAGLMGLPTNLLLELAILLILSVNLKLVLRSSDAKFDGASDEIGVWLPERETRPRAEVAK